MKEACSEILLRLEICEIQFWLPYLLLNSNFFPLNITQRFNWKLPTKAQQNCISEQEISKLTSLKKTSYIRGLFLKFFKYQNPQLVTFCICASKQRFNYGTKIKKCLLICNSFHLTIIKNGFTNDINNLCSFSMK